MMWNFQGTRAVCEDLTIPHVKLGEIPDGQLPSTELGKGDTPGSRLGWEVAASTLGVVARSSTRH